MASVEQALERLGKSRFRARFHLGPREQEYLRSKGLDAVIAHARDFIHDRLASATPANDGKQTPYHGHPAFIAQHATATCCRSCMLKWHGFPKGQVLTPEQQAYAVELIAAWLQREDDDTKQEPSLFG